MYLIVKGDSSNIFEFNTSVHEELSYILSSLDKSTKEMFEFPLLTMTRNKIETTQRIEEENVTLRKMKMLSMKMLS